ncbi:MAG TPA: tetratricopeptide repeat protein [Thermoanaerobaculia bacterium]|nr:tetratricopeptide repeat protein [Thermoanaerobaculia bacterium]
MQPVTGGRILWYGTLVTALILGTPGASAGGGPAHRSLGNLEHAERNLTTAVSILDEKAITPADRELLATARVALANVLKLQGKTATAEDLLEAVRQYDRENLPPDR